MKVKVNIEVSHLHELETEDYRDEWEEKCDEDGTVEEGADYLPVPPEFAIGRFKEDLDSGEQDLDTILETADIEVTPAV